MTRSRSATDQAAFDAYIGRLSNRHSRRGLTEALEYVADLASNGGTTAESFPWSRLTPERVSDLLDEMRRAGYAVSTRRRNLSAIRGVLREALALGSISAEHYQGVAELRTEAPTPARETRVLSDAEIRALFRACTQTPDARAARDAAILAALYVGGLRPYELCGLSVADYDPEQATLYVRFPREGSKPRFAYLSDSARDAIDRWLAYRGAQPGPLFTHADGQRATPEKGLVEGTIRFMTNRRSAQAGIQRASPDDLRMTRQHYLEEAERSALRNLQVPTAASRKEGKPIE